MENKNNTPIDLKGKQLMKYINEESDMCVELTRFIITNVCPEQNNFLIIEFLTVDGNLTQPYNDIKNEMEEM